MTDRELLELILKNQEKMQADIEQIKEDTEITREATNYIGSKFESLVNVLEETGVVSPHSI